MEIGEENLAQRAEQADFSKLVSALWECQAGQRRLEGEAEGMQEDEQTPPQLHGLSCALGMTRVSQQGSDNIPLWTTPFFVFEVQNKFK